MNNKTIYEKNVEAHKRYTRRTLEYVRLKLLCDKLAEEYDDVLHELDYTERKLCDDDLLVANFLIKAGIDLDVLTKELDGLWENDHVAPFSYYDLGGK